MNSSIICDYVTLFMTDAEENGLSDYANGVAVWDIPESAFYFKDRGSVCLMSIASASLPAEWSENVIIMTQQAKNGFTTQENSTAANRINDDLSVLGSFVNFTATGLNQYYTQYQSPQPIKVLTDAKPRQIRLMFFKDNKRAFDISAGEAEMEDEGHITLKFEYVNPEKLQDNIYSTEYKPAFPEV